MLIIFLTIMIVLLSCMLLLAILHTFELLPTKLMRLLCKFPSWHKPISKRSFDGCSFHSICKYCHEEIMQDGQGNWFTRCRREEK